MILHWLCTVSHQLLLLTAAFDMADTNRNGKIDLLELLVGHSLQLRSRWIILTVAVG